jgi:uncharacterized protein YegL
MAAKRVGVAVATFGPVNTVGDFQTADSFQPPMARAIEHELGMIREHKGRCRQGGIDYYRPWIFLITDGGPTDYSQKAAARVREGKESRAFMFFAVGGEGAKFDTLRQIATRLPPVTLVHPRWGWSIGQFPSTRALTFAMRRSPVVPRLYS